MKIESTAKWIGTLACAATLMMLMPVRSQAQAGGLTELAAGAAISGELASGSVGPGPGVTGNIQRARDVAGQANGARPNANPTNPSPTNPLGTAPGATLAAPAMPALPPAVNAILPNGPTITVLTGTRVFDAVTGALLDDAIQKQVKKEEASKYYDDGTHGDPAANDGELAKVDENHHALGLANQRFKEQLVKALLVADDFTPLQYFGIPIASAERVSSTPRNRTWSIVPDPNGGPGFTFREVPITSPISIPNYREKQKEKDTNIKNNWAVRFLQEFRSDKDDMTSQFYTLYIPLPPQPPAMLPPMTSAWTPFSDPGALVRAEQLERQNQLRGPMGQNGMMGGMGGMMMGGGSEGLN